MVVCPSCGTANPEGFRFCGACAAPLGPPDAGSREERKTVTVLFADLAGFTSRSETLDPEDVRAFLVPYYDALTTEITGHGGKVDRFLGDGIMALFGAPVAHEDDPERAVRAALRIVERVPALGLDLHVRVGINTGPVLFSAGTGGERDDAVTGDAVNTAARLQAAAPTDGVVVGEATYRATSHRFRYEALEPIRAKGKAEPVPLWRPLEPIARATGELMAETTPFVGRAFDLETLVRLFERSRSTPSLEVVTIIADPGIGKSRLVRELARHVDALPDLVTWRVGRCLPYGDGVSFWALGEIIKAHAGILDTDDQVTLSAKLDMVLTEPDLELRAWIKDRLAPLVGLETSTAPPGQEEVFTAWRRFLESIAQAGPTVLIVEDLHWADDAMVAFLGHVAANTAGLPILLVVTARPEVEERHPGWLGRARRSTVLSLGVLADRDMAALVEVTLPGASTGLVATVLDRAAGSPLYAEQLAAMFRDRLLSVAGGSLDETAVPPTIAALLAARIDALPPDAKAVLLDASVVGKTFWSGAVASLGRHDRAEVEPLLTELAKRELIRPAFPSTIAGEAEYTFVHALVRDVAYGELPRAARLARHRAAAAWITERAGATLGEDAEIVVAHLEQALGMAAATRATDEIRGIETGLIDALLAAADTAMRTEVPRAIADLRRALDLVPTDGRKRPEVLARLGRALIATSEFPTAAAILEQAVEAFRARGDELASAELGAPLAYALSNSGHADTAEAILAAARAVLERHPGRGLVSVVAAQAGLRSNGEHADAFDLAEEAIRLAASLGLPPPYRALLTRGYARWEGDQHAAEIDLRAAIAGAVSAGDVWAAYSAYNNLATMLAYPQGPASSLAVFDEAIAFADAHGLATERARAIRTQVLWMTGLWDELLHEAAEVSPWALAHGDIPTAATADWMSACVRLDRGQPIASTDGLESMARDSGAPPTWVAPVVAEAAVARGDADGARRALAVALDATPARELWNLARFVLACFRIEAPDLARRAIATGANPKVSAVERQVGEAILAEIDRDFASARIGYQAAAASYDSVASLPEEAVALAGLGRCLLAMGETEEGVARLRESRAIWERLRATPRVAEIDVLLTSPGAVPPTSAEPA